MVIKVSMNLKQNNIGVPGWGNSIRNSLKMNQMPDSLALALAFTKSSEFGLFKVRGNHRSKTFVYRVSLGF